MEKNSTTVPFHMRSPLTPLESDHSNNPKIKPLLSEEKSEEIFEVESSKTSDTENPHLRRKISPLRLRKTSLSRGFSDGSTMSVEEFRPRRIEGLFLTFTDPDFENDYQEFQLKSSRWWMHAVFLFQSICELILTVMNVFTYFELSGEFQKDVVPQDSKVRDSFPSETRQTLNSPTKHRYTASSVLYFTLLHL